MYVLKYTRLNQNHYQFIRYTNRHKHCIQISPQKMFQCTKTNSYNLIIRYIKAKNEKAKENKYATIDNKQYYLHLCLLVFNCHHFATDHLQEYVQFTIYHLQVSRVHLQCCEAQPISAVSPKICTIKLQQLHNTERPTKWSGHGKMIDPQEKFYL